jgi:peptidoglycan/LPS O-acetylase OafA/YrhL
MIDRSRNLWIDAIRTVAISAMMCTHLFLSGTAQSVGGPNIGWFDYLWVHSAPLGIHGINSFFVVSGYLITQMIDQRSGSVTEPDLMSFYISRIGRIIPLTILAVTIGILILSVPYMASWPAYSFCFRSPKAKFDTQFWLSLSTFTFNWLRIFKEKTCSSFGLQWDIFWSLSVEEQFYFFYPLFLRSIRSKNKLKAALWAIVISGPISRVLFFHLQPDSALMIAMSTITCADAIATGCLFYLYFPTEKLKGYSPTSGLFFILLAMLLAIIVNRFVFAHPLFGLPLGNTLLAISVCLFILGGNILSVSDSAIRRHVPRAFLDAISLLTTPGRLSLGYFFWHPLVLFLMFSILRGKSPAQAFCLYFLAVLALAQLSFSAFEQPMRKKLQGSLYELVFQLKSWQAV